MASETEPNDTISNATALSARTTTTGQLSQSTDQDWYRISVAAPGVVAVVFDVPTASASAYFRLAVYNPAGALLQEYTTGSDANYQFTATAAGTYYLQVAASGLYSSGTYSLNVNPDTTPPSAVAFSPAPSAVGVVVDANLSITFSESVRLGTGSIVIRDANTGIIVESFDAASSTRLSIRGSTLTIDPTARLPFSSNLQVDIPASAITDLAGNRYAGTSAYSFRTQANPDVVAGNATTDRVLAVEGVASGVIDYSGDTDWWKVNLRSGFGYQVWLEGVSAGAGTLGDPYLAVYNAAGELLAFNDDISTPGNRDSHINFVPATTGTYFLSAEEFEHDASGTYRLTVWVDQLASAASAASVAANSLVTDRIGWRSDTSDWYRIDLTAGQTYQFDLTGSRRDGSALALQDPWLALRASDGSLLRSDNDSGLGANARILFTPTQSGTYFLDVQEFGANAAGVYALIVNQSPVRADLTLGSSSSGSLEFKGDLDLYPVTLEAGVKYVFSVEAGTLADPFLEVLDQAFRVLDSDDDGGTGLNSQLTFTATRSGLHYLAARASGDTSTGTYTAAAWALPRVSIADATVVEGNTGTRSLDFVVSLSNPSRVPVSFTAGTRASTASTASGDYQGVSAVTLTIPPGATQATFSVPVNGDTLFEPNEGLRALITSPVMAEIADGEARGWILDDDAPIPLPRDWLVRYQWHLYPRTGANVFEVWESWTGAGVRVGVFDQGIDPLHTDLDGNLLTSLGRVSETLRPGGAPLLASDNHGTAVAGVIAAESDGLLTVGVAPGASLVSIYSPLSGSISAFATEITNAYVYARSLDVLNDSWGFAPQGSADFSAIPWAMRDNFRSPTFAAAGQALKDLAELGRGGLGTVVVQSAGNSYNVGDDTNLHNFQNSRYIITVAATDYGGSQTAYSSPGASILVAAPGGGGNDFLGNILTTDRVGSAGYQPGDYDDIAGTSFSAPVVSGVVALMLQANPALGYRDVQQILAYTARVTAEANNDWRYNGAGNWNGGGLRYDAVDHNLGFGLVDALAAVRLAETWSLGSLTSANDIEVSSTRSQAESIPDGTSAVRQSVTITNPIEVERVEVTIGITHPYIGDLSILLTSPAGTNSWLMWRPGQSALSAFGQRQANIDFTFNTVLSLGESGVGVWTLSVFDMAAGDAGQLNSWTLNLVGKPDSADDLYVYTPEFSEAVARQPSRSVLTDAGGADTLNAAAVTTAMSIDLQPGARSTIDGQALTIASATFIENVVGGDGGDVLRGNALNNVIRGMRGNDIITGGLGDDRILGGSGRDEARFGVNRSEAQITRVDADTLTVSSAEGSDTLVSIERLVFTDKAIAFDVEGIGGKTYRLYKAAYDRVPDAAGVGFWMHYLDNGFDMVQAATNFLNSDEFRVLYDNDPAIPGYQEPSIERFVTKLYRHVLQRAPEGEGYQFWVDAMYNKNGAFGKAWSRADVLLQFAESTENKINVVGLIQSGFEYAPFVPPG